MKRLLALILAAFMLVLPLVSCSDAPDSGDDSDTGNTPADGTDTDTAAAPDEILEIPDEKFPDIEFTVLTNELSVWDYTHVDFDEPSDDPLDNSVYQRNVAVEELLGCSIAQYATNSSGSVLQTAVDAGDTEGFDVAILDLTACGTNVGSGRCYDLTAFQYLDLTKSWWDINSVEQLAIGGKNYMVGGDMFVSDDELLWLMFFTKDMVANLGLENPYELVENGQWTWDKMIEMIEKAAYDENANGVFDEADIYGLMMHDYHYSGMWVSAEQRIVRLDDEGMPYQTWGEESFVNVYEKIIELANMEGVRDISDQVLTTKMQAGETLFVGEVVGWVSGYRNNEYDFGLLPMPKYSADQDEYYTIACSQSDLLVIGNNQDDTYSTGIILEAMAAKGQEIITPMYYEKQLQSRHSRDEESSAMLDIIFKNKVYDIGAIFNWSDVAWQLMNPRSGANPATLYASHKKAFQKTMEKDLEKILNQ